MTSSETRAKLVEALRLDLVGPWPGHAFAGELLPENPNRWYLTGYLVPETAPVHQREDAEAKEEIDSGAEGGGMDDAGAPDKSAPPSLLPSSMGLSVLVPAGASKLKAEVTWGDYHWEDPSKEDEEPGDQGLGVPDETKQESDEQSESPVAPANEPLPAASAAAAPKGFRRTHHAESVEISLPAPGSKLVEVPVPNSGGLRVVVTARAVTPDSHGRLPVGTKAVCVFVVNGRQPGERAYQGNAFQACLRVTSPAGFIARPDLRGGEDGARRDDWDEQVADLQYRRSFDYVSGIGCAAEAIDMEEGGPCHAVQTCWIPSAEVEFVGHLESSALAGVELSMEALSLLGSVDEARTKLGGLVDLYRAWITTQESAIKADVALEANRLKAANELFQRARLAADRMSAGIELLAKDDIREAFCTANRAMARQARQRDAQKYNIAPDKATAPAWRAFQLGFILLNLRGLADPLDHDRQLVDLLFFPTGGGKTEAYLGLAAFSLVLRRLRNPGRRGAGVNVLMRYTLRLLTLDQLGRASALICALELERQERAKRSDLRLGDWPFEIGLWVGSAATPNRMGRPGDSGPGADMSAYRRVRRFRADSKKNPSPIPLENCPWCGVKFNAHSFRLLPSEKDPQDLRITCVNAKCAFTGDQPLPIIAVPTADTYTVVQNLFQEAQEEVVLAGYAFYNGRMLFERLAEQQRLRPKLKILFHVDLPRRHNDTASSDSIILQFAEEFKKRHWPWERFPEVYFDPRALSTDSKIRASLHAKIVVVDRKKLFLTSANFTEAAHQKNIEMGLLCAVPYLAERVGSYLEGLRRSGQLLRLP